MADRLISRKEAARLARTKERAKARIEKRKAWVTAYFEKRGFRPNRYYSYNDFKVVGGVKVGYDAEHCCFGFEK